MHLQAGITDNTPIYMLGGNILPFAQGGMTTSAAKASNVTLVVAFTSVWAAAAVERCSSKCSAPKVNLPTSISISRGLQARLPIFVARGCYGSTLFTADTVAGFADP